MDKKAKKRVAVLRERLQKLQKIRADANQQCDDPAEITELDEQIEKTQQEISHWTA